MPQIGSRVRVVSYNSGVYDSSFPPVRRYTEHVGEVIQKEGWEPGNAFVMTDTLHKRWPMPVIAIGSVLFMEFLDGVTEVRETGKKPSDRTWRVASSSGGTEYVVTRVHESWTCSCKGFQFRKSCKHVTEKQTEEQREFEK